MSANLVWFSEIGRDDVARAGGKGANLGELTLAGLPVPPGFVVIHRRSVEERPQQDRDRGRLRVG